MLLAFNVQAGSYSQNFSFPNNTVALGDGSAITSNNGVASVQGGTLRLTAAGITNTTAAWKLPVLDPARRVEAFDIAFTVRMTRNATETPADGWALNFGTIPVGHGSGETGFVMPGGLVIGWDTYANKASDIPSIQVLADGLPIFDLPQEFPFDNIHRNVAIHWDAQTGLDISYDGVAICTDVPTPGFHPGPGDCFAITARTGGASEDVAFDSVVAATMPVLLAEPGTIVISEIHYAPLPPSASESAAGFNSAAHFEWVELLNVSQTNIDLQGSYFTAAIAVNLTSANPLLVLQPGARVLIVASREAFAHRYGSTAANRVVGVFGGSLDDAGETLTMFGRSGASLQRFAWGTAEPWPVAAAGAGYSLVLNTAATVPAPELPSRWRASASVGGTPGEVAGPAFTGSVTADSNADGVSDYLEFATGTAVAPRVSIHQFNTGGVTRDHLQLRYQQNLASEGCQYEVQASPDLAPGSWSAAGATYVKTVHNGDGTAEVTFRSTASLLAQPRLFMRLRVTR